MSGTAFDWVTLSSDFAPDGSLRDIYIFDSTRDDWQAVLDAVRNSGLPLRFLVDGEPAQLPERVADIFAMQERVTPSLQINCAGLRVGCHFFADDEIEFDLSPREVSGQDGLDAVAAFMKMLAETVKKDVVLTHEDTPSAVILRYPAG